MPLLNEHGQPIPDENSPRYLFKPTKVLNLIEVTEFLHLLAISFSEEVFEQVSERLANHFVPLEPYAEVFPLPGQKMNGD